MSVSKRGMPDNTRAVALCVFLIATACVTPQRVWAQCGGGYPGVTTVLNGSSDIATVFSGTVAETQTLDTVVLVTFDVDGIWKGDVAKRVVVYRPIYKASAQNVGGASGRLRPFEIGRRYLVLAHILSEQATRELGLQSAAPGALAVDVCGSGSRPYELMI